MIQVHCFFLFFHTVAWKISAVHSECTTLHRRL